MKELKLANSTNVALVDDEDFERLSKFRWYDSSRTIKRTKRQGRRVLNIALAREVLQCFENLLHVDHIDRNKFNNQKSNLRLATFEENMANRQRPNLGAYASSIYRGVTPRVDRGTWRASLAGKILGTFKTEIEAARCYDLAAKKKYKEFAVLNFT
jgi:hypothetical protein